MQSTIFKKITSVLSKNWVFYPIIMLMALYVLFALFFTIGINKTPSVPFKYYVFYKHADPAESKPGDVVLMKYTNNFAFPFGSRFVKYVAGVPGDVVTHIGQDVYVNDKHIGTAKLFGGPNQEGEPLDMSRPGVIPLNHFFLYTPYEDSFDSRYRYVGLVDKRSILGKSIFAFGSLDNQEEVN